MHRREKGNDKERFFGFNKEKHTEGTNLVDKFSRCEENIKYLNLYEIKLNKISSKFEDLIILALKIKSENEKTNDIMVRQEKNLKDIDSLIQSQINVISKLADDIDIYKKT